MKAKKARHKMRLRRGDIVQVIAGDEGTGDKSGKVMLVDTGKQRAVVEGLNLVKKHIRKSQDHPQGGIVDKEAPIHISNLKVIERAAKVT
jgi:large subunit ribosomal protein L24